MPAAGRSCRQSVRHCVRLSGPRRRRRRLLSPDARGPPSAARSSRGPARRRAPPPPGPTPPPPSSPSVRPSVRPPAAPRASVLPCGRPPPARVPARSALSLPGSLSLCLCPRSPSLAPRSRGPGLAPPSDLRAASSGRPHIFGGLSLRIPSTDPQHRGPPGSVRILWGAPFCLCPKFLGSCPLWAPILLGFSFFRESPRPTGTSQIPWGPRLGTPRGSPAPLCLALVCPLAVSCSLPAPRFSGSGPLLRPPCPSEPVSGSGVPL